MGEVYRARDTRLKRDVAIKVVPEHLAKDPQALNRFEREAQAVAAISHPNILAVYDVGTEEGTSFVVTELLEGETLRESVRRSTIPWRKAIEYGVAIADGLAAAHARGVIHRDLKPENIFLTTDGVVKILDFGLARIETATPPAERADTPTMTLDTRPGTVLGTVNYMSPEQVRGLKTDARSDIFSFGCVLYEMLARHRAFTGATPADTMTAILKEEAPDFESTRAEVAPEVERIIARCLEKKSELRIQSARDLGFALRDILSDSGLARPVVTGGPSRTGKFLWIMAVIGVVAVGTLLAVLSIDRWTARRRDAADEGRRYTLRQPGPGAVESLAVLPLENLSGDPQQEYFADAMTDAIIDDLAKISALRVISRTSVMRYKGTDKLLPEIAGELNVDAVVEGTALLAGDRVRIRVRLIEATTERQVWGDRYERDIRDILAIQSEVARAIAEGIQIKLTPAEKAMLASTESVKPDAYDAYMTGLGFVHRGTEEACRTALRFFEQALEIDPDFALAHAGRAQAYSMLSDHHLAPKETMPFAKSAAMNALVLDDTLAEAHTALGRVRLQYEWNWSAARESFERAMELNPSLTDARLGYAEYLTAMKRGDEAMAQLDMVRERDPASLYTHESHGAVSFMARRFDRTIRDCTAAIEVDPEFWSAHMWLGLAQGQTGEFSSGIHHLRRALKLNNTPLIAATLGSVLALSGQRTEAEAVLEELKEREERDYVCPYELATISIALGDHEEAFTEMDRACDGRASCLPWLQVDPRVDPLRPDPRFDDLLRRVGFEPEERLLRPVEPRRERTVLAVLPFEGLGSGADTVYLKEEIPASIIHGLSNLSGLQVIPRSTAFRYEVGDKDTASVGRALGATTVLTGQINAVGGGLTIRAELVDVSSNRQLWDERYNRKVADIMAIEEDIAREISEALRLQLTYEDKARLGKRYTDNAEAYRAYLQGRFWWNKRTKGGFAKAIAFFDEAIRSDATYALAYAGKADTYSMMGYYTHRPTEVAPLAREAANTAIRLDPRLAEAYPPLGWVHALHDWDWEAAERAFRKAIELKPRYATAHHWYAVLLVALGRFEEAAREIDEALQLDPGSLIINREYATVVFFQRDFDLALQRCRHAVEMDPMFAPAHKIQGDIYTSLGRYDEAIAEFRKLVELEGRAPKYAGALGYAYGLAGRRAEALEELRILAELSTRGVYVPAGAVGLIHAGLGNFDAAFDWLDKACDERDNDLPFFKFAPTLDVLRSDPRFDALLKKMNLPPYPPAPVVAPWPAATSPTGKAVLAVLPFERMSTDPDTDYLSEEIPASIIDSLSSLSELRVIPRSTAFRCKIGDRDIASIGRDLNATAVLTGQINARGDDLRIRAELVDVATNRQLWSERYDRTLTDILAIERDITDRLSEALKVRLTGEDRTQLAKRSTENAEAHRAYLEGRFWWNRRSREGYSKAIELFDEAIRLDPAYALAYAGKADCYCLMVLLDSPPKKCIPKAREAAEQALAVNGTLAEAHASLGWIKWVYDWDWPGAERSFKRAIELNPRYATARNWYGPFLASIGRDDEAVEQITRAIELDPGSLIINRDLGVVYSWTGQIDRAIDQLHKTVQMDPLFAPAHAHLGRVYGDAGMYDKAIAEMEIAADLAGGVTHAGFLGESYARAGRRDDAIRELEKITELSKHHDVPAHKFALIHAGLGDKDQAFEWLEKAFENKEFPMVILQVGQGLGSLRDDPRFDNLLRRIGLPVSAREEPSPSGERPE
jgi:serine/threonine-protein kinase